MGRARRGAGRPNVFYSLLLASGVGIFEPLKRAEEFVTNPLAGNPQLVQAAVAGLHEGFGTEKVDIRVLL